MFYLWPENREKFAAVLRNLPETFVHGRQTWRPRRSEDYYIFYRKLVYLSMESKNAPDVMWFEFLFDKTGTLLTTHLSTPNAGIDFYVNLHIIHKLLKLVIN